jgi:ATP-dependent RNA helicase RhlE
MLLDDKLKRALKIMGFINPTEIQSKTIEALINKKNVLGIANTGTGKTGAFLIPIIHRLLTEKKFQTLVVLPTRELALQVEKEFQSLASDLHLRSASFIGGTKLDKDFQKLKSLNDIVIGTPGRLIDLINQGALKLNNFEVLILDEFDRMLDMGFIRDIEKILSAMKLRKQTMLFSATVDQNQDNLIKKIIPNPVRILLHSGNSTTSLVDQDIIDVQGGDKFAIFRDLISREDFRKVLVFAETKRSVDRLSKKLIKSGISADTIHGDKSQNYRIKALNNFKLGKIKILVATDVAARGIDIMDITHVINYQPPTSMDSYIHRIGRTGRAGKKGFAYTFINEMN